MPGQGASGAKWHIQRKLKPVERRLGTLKKHLQQADIYFKCKGKNPLTEAEQILFTTAKDYPEGVMNGKTTIPSMERRIYQADRREEKTQSAVSCIERGSERSRENQKERLQYLAAGTARTTAPLKAGYGAITGKAARLSTSAPPPCFGLLLDR